MPDAKARKAAIERASAQVRTGTGFMRRVSRLGDQKLAEAEAENQSLRQQLEEAKEEHRQADHAHEAATKRYQKAEQQLEQLREAALGYIGHLRRDKGHRYCRRNTGPGTYECGFVLDWLAALAELEKGEK